MQSLLTTFLTTGVLAFMLVFCRIGSALMLMPGLGDTFIPDRIRLHTALAISFVLFPMVMPYVPVPVPSVFPLMVLMAAEIIIGILIGTMARIFMMALDTAGMIVSSQSGLANAQVFNPALASQGSLVGTFFVIAGIVLLFVMNLHHLLLAGIIESYNFFPLGAFPETGDMAEMISRAVSASFLIGIKISMPFIVVTMVVYVGMGVLTRLMPQVQVFILALPIQILLSMITLVLVMSALFYQWLEDYKVAMLYFFSVGAQ